MTQEKCASERKLKFLTNVCQKCILNIKNPPKLNVQSLLHFEITTDSIPPSLTVLFSLSLIMSQTSFVSSLLKFLHELAVAALSNSQAHNSQRDFFLLISTVTSVQACACMCTRRNCSGYQDSWQPCYMQQFFQLPDLTAVRPYQVYYRQYGYVYMPGSI